MELLFIFFRGWQPLDPTLRIPDGISTVWGWEPTSGLLPCSVYLRHCYLAVEKAGKVALESFLNDSLLADRKTTLRAYIEMAPEVMEARPPPHLEARFSG